MRTATINNSDEDPTEFTVILQDDDESVTTGISRGTLAAALKSARAWMLGRDE